MAAVKSRTSRRERSRETRRRMVDSARDLFASRGYAATTMEDIAAGAGVAVQTVYYSFRTKGNLVCEVVEVAGAGGHDHVPVIERDWMVEAMSTSSADRALALAVEHGTDIYVRAAPLWPAVAAAAAVDEAVQEYWNRVATKRRTGMARLVARLADLGCLREGLDPARAADLLYVLDGHEVFTGLTSHSGWTVPEYKSWLFTTLRQQLLAPADLDPHATHGLSFVGSAPDT